MNPVALIGKAIKSYNIDKKNHLIGYQHEIIFNED